MTVHIHHLTGCAPIPLAHYLKALGILRLVSEQADPNARGWWKDECFHLATTLDEEALLDFFLLKYAPTPLISPWNGGSGFYPKDKKEGIDAIFSSLAPRFSLYRSAINKGHDKSNGLKESPKKEKKNNLLQHCRREWRGPLLNWLDATLVLTENGEPKYPALLGTGGNDGRLDFTNNFMQRLAELFDCNDPEGLAAPTAKPCLKAALYNQAEAGMGRGKAIGQFLPGNAGGANSTTGFSGDSLVNPWDFVLMLEGTICFSASVARRNLSEELPQAAAPFSVRATAAGYGSAATADEGARGEQWMPLWGNACSFAELKALIAEGRCQLGKRTAGRPLDLARAIARLGVSRGVTAFQRFGYIERNGQANLATPLGRWEVHAQPHQDLIDQVALWVDRLRRAGSGKNAPASIARVARNCEEAIMACCRNGNDSSRWQDLLLALGQAEACLLKSPRFTAGKYLRPLSGLTRDWLAAADDGNAELRLALSLAAQFSPDSNGKIDWKNPVRRHFIPLDKAATRFNTRSEGLVHDPNVVCTSNDLLHDCIALVRRRVLQADHGLFPLIGIAGTWASLADIAAFLRGELNEGRILGLARPLMAIKWEGFRSRLQTPLTASADIGSLSLYSLLRLAHLPEPLSINNIEIAVRLDPSIIARLCADDLHGAVTIAARRLQASGLRPYLKTAVGNPGLTRRLAASLAFPVNPKDLVKLAKRLTRPNIEKESTALV